jgi:hypothetical protein
VFARVVAARRWIVLAYALLVPFAVLLALRIPRDTAIEHMVVPSDPDVAATRAFHRVFPEPPALLLLVETRDPFAPAALTACRELEARLARLAKVSAYSLLTVWQRTQGGRSADQTALRRFATGTQFFRRQGLVGDDFLGIALALDVEGPGERDRALAQIERVIGEATADRNGPIVRVRKVGSPWLESWLEHESSAASVRYFPLFGLFVVALTLGLFRSFRALATILTSLALAVLLGVAVGGLAGFSFTIVSALVPLTLMITCTASLVYLHARFVDQPDDVHVDDHRVDALANKFPAVTASVFAAAVGFAALAVSHIRPIRELGLWTAAGLALGWLVCFTFYPALQTMLGAPTRRERRVAGGWVSRVALTLPRWSYRWRWALLPASLALALAGAAALFGIPGVLPAMRLETQALDYVDPDLPIAEDTRYFAANVAGLTTVNVWVTTPAGVLDPHVLAGLDAFAGALERDARVGAVVGLPAVMRLRRYAAGQGADLPRDQATFVRIAAELEQLVLLEPGVRRWVDMNGFASTYLQVVSPPGEGGIEALAAAVRAAWERAAATSPALARGSYQIVGTGVLEATITGHLVPTLTHSFALTFAVIFVTFLLVFRSGAARLNAMVPSLFAILATFLLMRLTGIPLNVATILIATTVLGATENDQIHFFYHFQERRGIATEAALAHAIRVAGHAILFATLINAAGFLALTLSHFPPIRQFGVVTAAAFLLAMLADFTALPAALWFFFRARPQSELSAAS